MEPAVGSREQVIWMVLPAAAVVLAVVGVSSSLGYMCSRTELRQLRHQNQALELELEERLASGAPPPDAEAPGEAAPADAEALADAEAAEASRSRLDELETRVAGLGREKERLARELSTLRKKNQKLDAELRSARQKRDRAERDLAALRSSLDSVASEPQPSPNPAKAAPPPVDAPGAPPASADVSASGCADLAEPHWELTRPGEDLTRLGGALSIRAQQEPDGVFTLQLGGERAPRRVLGDPPQHFSWSCGGADYVVSVCAAQPSPFRVAGRIWEAGDRWPDPCGS